MTAIWLTASGFFGIAYLLSARSVRVEEAVFFTVAFGTAAAVSAVVAMTVGAKRRWAIEAALPMAILIAAPIGAADALTWLAPTMSRNLPTVNYFPEFGRRIPAAILGISRRTIPSASMLGTGVGVISGLSTVFIRRWPRSVGLFLAVLLVFCVIGSVHIVAFERIVDFVMQSIPFELPTAIGATAGAVVGAVVGAWAVRIGCQSRLPSPM